MSNVNTAFGLRPIGISGSAPNSTGVTEYRIAANNANAIYQGQPVIALNTGFIARISNATGNALAPLGVFMGCQYVDAASRKPVWSNYWPGVAPLANTVVRAYVADNPNQLFLVASSATLTDAATAQAAVFRRADLASGQSGSSATGLSSAVLDVTTFDDADACLRIVGISEDEANSDVTSAGLGLIVRFERHYNAPAAGGPVVS
jgi:hypothetical protein